MINDLGLTIIQLKFRFFFHQLSKIDILIIHIIDTIVAIIIIIINIIINIFIINIDLMLTNFTHINDLLSQST